MIIDNGMHEKDNRMFAFLPFTKTEIENKQSEYDNEDE